MVVRGRPVVETFDGDTTLMAWVSKFGDDDVWPEEEPIILPSTMAQLSAVNSMAALPSSMDLMTSSATPPSDTPPSATPLSDEDARLLELSQVQSGAPKTPLEKVEKTELVVRSEQETGEFGDTNGDDDSNCFDDDGFAIACGGGGGGGGNADETTMARLIKALTKQRKLAGFDLWGGAPEWGDKAGRAPLDATGVVGLANVALQHGLVQEMVGLPQSYKDQLKELVGDGNYLTEHDIAGLNPDDRGALAQLMSGVFTKMHETQSPGFWSRVWEGFKDLDIQFWQSIFGEAPSAAQISQGLVDLTTSGLGKDIMDDPEVAVRKLQDIRQTAAVRTWPESESYGELHRQQNPLYQWG